METNRIGIGTPLQKAYSKKKCPNCGTKFDIINVELQNYIDGNIVWKKEDIAYCYNCNELFFRSDYDDFIYKHPGYFDYKLVQHVKEKMKKEKSQKTLIVDQTESKKEKTEPKLKQTELRLGLGIEQTKINSDKENSEKYKIIKKEEKQKKVLPKADFFVRTNINNCSKKKHNIIDLIAEVDVICSNGNIIKKTFPASYCEDCKLYFMYDNDYKRIRRSGVPLCSIYEYLKYIKINKNRNIELKPESLLHSFGYNVGVTENLSTNQRRKILSFVINKGIMSKHEIMNLLNYFVDFRKKDKRQAKAISKWKMDIEYLQNTNIEATKKIEVNSIRIINRISK